MTPVNSSRMNRSSTKKGPEKGSLSGSAALLSLRPWQIYIFMAALVLTTFLAYRPAWRGTPLMDDDMYLIDKPELRPLSGLVSLWIEPHIIRQSHARQYHPLVDTLFWAEDKLWSESMLGHHLLSVAMHAISALMLWKILRQLAIPGAWLASGIFALHPIYVDSVAWLAEAKNTLSGVFFFGCLLAYLRFDQTRSRRAYGVALLLFVLGLLAKTIVAMVVIVLPIVFWWKRGRLNWERDLKPLVPFFILGAAAGVLTGWMEQNLSGAEGREFEFSVVERLLIVGHAFWFYLTKLFWPANLIFIYPRWEINSSDWWQYIFPLGMLCLFTLAVMLRNSWPAILAGLLIFGIVLAPTLGFFNVTFFRYSFVSDHFQYLPSLGIVVPVAAGGAILIERLDRFKIVGIAAALLLLGTLAFLTWNHSVMYRDNDTCSRMVIEKNPNHWQTLNNRGVSLLKNNDLNGAIDYFGRALRNAPRGSHVQKQIYVNLGHAYSRQGRLDDAIAQFEKCLSLAPDVVEAHHDLANIFQRQGRYSEAIAHFKSALEANPRSALTMNNLAWLLVTCADPSTRNGPAALELASHANALAGGADPLILHTLAAAYAENGQFTQAIDTAERALPIAEKQHNEFLVRALPQEIARYRSGLPVEKKTQS